MWTYAERRGPQGFGQLLPEPKEKGRSLEAVVIAAVQAAPHRPTLEVVLPLPQVRPRSPEAVKSYALAASEAIGETAPHRDHAGRPPRNLYVAAEVAVMFDIERRSKIEPPLDISARDARERLKRYGCPTCGKGLRPVLREPSGRTVAMLVCALGHQHPEPGAVGPFSMLDYLGPNTATMKTIDRWRNDGRAFLAQLGAWPWALTPDGRLSRVWWRDQRFSRALGEWCEGGRRQIWTG